ncbi:MAG: aryl-sulfate sulfotransferase [Myxococcales bacterium]|nr:aryl-sulfate sulfotransferase [Myxococcales bacterium]
MDQDGFITTADAAESLRVALGAVPSPAPASEAFLAADASGDGTLDGGDAVVILAEAAATEAAVPVVSGFRLSDNPRNSLSVYVDFTTDLPARPRVRVESIDGAWTVPTTGTLTDAPGTTHRVGVVGLREGVTYTIKASALGPGGAASAEVSATRKPVLVPRILIPSLLPLTVALSEPDHMAPGVTVFGLLSPAYLFSGYIFALDAQGRVVWYFTESGVDPFPGSIQEVTRAPSGNLVYMSADVSEYRITEIDAFGNRVRRWRSGDLGVDSLHHSVDWLPNGNLVTLSTELRTVGGYPGGQTFDLVADVVTEITPQGDVADQIPLLDVLDPYRVRPGFNDADWILVYGPTAKDWSHGNAVVYDATDDTFIVSLRHQDLIAKIDRQTHALVWVLGEDDPSTTGDDAWPFLTLVGEGRPPNHQHSPRLRPGGRLLVYDNGNSVGFTRVVEYAIDAQAMTVTQEWEWADGEYSPLLFAPFVGGVQALSNGNFLVAYGGLGTSIFSDEDPTWTLLHEFDPNGQKVWEVQVRGNVGYQGYRAERMSSLYRPEP